MPVLKVKKENGAWQDIATANTHAHTVSDISDLPASIVDDVESLKDKVGAESVAYQITTAIQTNEYVHPYTHPATMITGLSDVAISGSYEDLTDKPTIPSITGLATKTYVDEQIASVSGSGGMTEQVQADWNETDTTSPAYIKNKPTISGEGGASVQANWEQNDSTQADYIKNRPFGEENITELLIDGNYKFLYSEGNGFALENIIPITSDIHLTIGEIYMLVFEGVEYSCECYDCNGMPIVGFNIMTGENADVPVAIAEDVNGDIFGAVGFFVELINTPDPTVTTEVTYDIKLSFSGAVIKHLDNKYIPIMEYIKPKEVDMLPSTQYGDFYFNSDYGVYMYEDVAPCSLVVDKQYTVYWDGVKYELTVQDANNVMSGAIAIGNASPFGLSGNNEPFLIVFVNGYVIYISLTDTEAGGSHTVRIVGMTSGHYILKEEYNPKPDWNELNISSNAYIKNKPFYELSAGTVIVNETTVNCNQPLQEFLYYAIIDEPNIIGGYQYEIYYDGTPYVLTAQGDNDQATIVYDGDNNIFFAIAKNIENTGMNMFISTAGQHTFKVILSEDIIKTIDPKFIPKIDGLPEVTADDNGKTLLVSEGIWSVAEPVKGVPEVSDADDGKFLRVVNGVWMAVTVDNAEEVSF